MSSSHDIFSAFSILYSFQNVELHHSFKGMKNCFDFLSEPFSFSVLLDFSTEELRLVVKLSPDRLFVRKIIRDPLSSRF